MANGPPYLMFLFVPVPIISHRTLVAVSVLYMGLSVSQEAHHLATLHDRVKNLAALTLAIGKEFEKLGNDIGAVANAHSSANCGKEYRRDQRDVDISHPTPMVNSSSTTPYSPSQHYTTLHSPSYHQQPSTIPHYTTLHSTAHTPCGQSDG